MKEIEYKVKSEGFSGSIILNLPSYKEKLAILKELKIKVGADGASAAEQDGMELVEKLYAKLESMVKSVDLKYDEVEFKSLDDLGYYAEGQLVVSELQNLLTSGVSLGKG